MKKLFLIPLMALFSCVMAWGSEITVSNFAALKAQLSASGTADVVKLANDIPYQTDGSDLLNIQRSVTIDGQGHEISGYGNRSGKSTTIAINNGGTSNVSVVLKDLTIRNAATGGRPIETRGKITSLTLDNVKVYATGSGNTQGLTIGGNQATTAEVVMTNSLISMNYTKSGVTKSSGYCVISFNPYHLVATNSTFDGWAALYFKGEDGSAGSNGTVVEATNCTFNCINKNTGNSNTFGAFALEDGGINITLDNCVVDARYTDPTKAAKQSMFLLSPWKTYKNNHTTAPCSLTIKGANSRVIGDFIDYGWNNEETPVPVTFELQGGSYYANDFETGVASGWVYINENKYVAVKMENNGEPIYRISLIPAANINTDDPENPIVTFYGINDNVENQGAGTNPTTAFAVMEGETVEMVNNNTVADYVLVASPTTEDQTILKVGKKDGEEKVNQTLVVNSGLDVQSDAQVIVQPGSTLQIGAGGIVTENTESIIVEADEEGAASLLLDPSITINNTPELTVKMKAKQIGWATVAGEKSYFWHRFALPIQGCTTWVKYPNKSTYVFGWNYTANDWEQLSALTQMVPFKGYTLTADYENQGDIEYTFTGQLAGNTNNALQFERNGFNFFGNSYTGYIDVLALVDQIMGDNKIDGTVWMWYQDNQSYVAVPLQALRDNPATFDSWMREVAPMQTFILKQNGSENATAELNYASAVWGNPRYGNVETPAPTSGSAPARRAATDETTRMRIIVTAENGKSDFVMLTEDGKFSDAFEKGYDGEKYMNENTLNMYATIDGANYTAVATDNLEGKMMTIKTVEAVNYTMSFAKVNGEEYAIRDNATGAVIAIEEGATYEFAAQPNSVIEGRFEMIGARKVTTAIENTEVKANVKGIYTIMGQYLGEDFDVLPAGIYIVNGVKIVK